MRGLVESISIDAQTKGVITIYGLYKLILASKSKSLWLARIPEGRDTGLEQGDRVA
jgi:hypothetical protein